MNYNTISKLTIQQVLLNFVLVISFNLLLIAVLDEPGSLFSLMTDLLFMFVYSVLFLGLQSIINLYIIRSHRSPRAQWMGVIISAIIVSTVVFLLIIFNGFSFLGRQEWLIGMPGMEYCLYSIFGLMIGGFIVMRKVRAMDETYDNPDILDL